MPTAEPLQDLQRDGSAFGRMLKDRDCYRRAVEAALREHYGELFAKQAMERARVIYEDLKRREG